MVQPAKLELKRTVFPDTGLLFEFRNATVAVTVVCRDCQCGKAGANAGDCHRSRERQIVAIAGAAAAGGHDPKVVKGVGGQASDGCGVGAGSGSDVARSRGGTVARRQPVIEVDGRA